MPNLPDYSWPPMDQRRVIGKPTKRRDGLEKSTGRAKYSSDLKPPGMLFGALLTSPYAHARITSIDTSEAEHIAGVTAVRVMTAAGKEVQWEGAEIAAVAAVSEELANDAVRKIKVQYEVLPHLVREDDLAKAGNRAKPAGEQVTGDLDKAFQEADAVIEGSYVIPVITHCCLEPHGNIVQFSGDRVNLWPSTQNVSGIGGDLGKSLEVPATNVHVQMQYIGGGFGSKFVADNWGVQAGLLSKASGGKPVKMYLDRATELKIAGNRPSAFANIKVAAKKDGTITAWQSVSWATGGMGGGGMPPLPYVFTGIPNIRLNHTAVAVNAGGARAWRAPNHPQASFLTCSALEDLAAKLRMDPLELFGKNLGYTAREATYKAQLQKALVEDLFRGSLGEENCFAFWILHQHGHHAPREVERDLVQLLVLLDHRFPVKVGAIQDGHVEQVLETRLEVADQVAVQKHFLGFPAGNIAVPLEDDAIFGERAGLVGAQNIHAAEVLDGVESLDDHLLAAHGERPLGEADGNDHGQHLGGEAHGHGHCEEKSALPIVLGEPVDEEDQGYHNRHEPDHQPCEAVETLIEACRRLGLRDGAGHAAEIGVDPRRGYHCCRRAALDACAHEARVLELSR